MNVRSVEIAQRVDNKYNVWANVSFHELFQEKQTTPIEFRQWLVIEVCDTPAEADKFCSTHGLAYKILPNKYN